MVCQGQLRLVPSGQVIGIDLGALNMAAARDYDIAVLLELLPAAEMGMVEALPLAKDSHGTL